MFNALFLIGATLAAQAQCPLSEKAPAGEAFASAALAELAQKRGVLESEVGAVLILRRDEACEILEQQRNLLAETKQAIENECQQFIFLAPGSEQQYMSAAKGYLRNRQPTLVLLAWALPSVADAPLVHIVLVSDGASAVRLSSPGYGREGPSTLTCVDTPWRW